MNLFFLLWNVFGYVIFSHKEVIFGIQKLPFFLLAKRIHSIPTSTKYLRKEKKEPPPNDTEKKKILNFKENKMTPPLCTLSRTTHCCLSIVSEANTYVSASGTASIPLHRRQQDNDSFFLTTPLLISRTHLEKDYCIFFFLFLFSSYF